MTQSKSIYLIYSHEYNIGYVGKSSNLRNIFYEHCGDNRSCVKQFCKNLNIHARDTFEIYEIMKCNAADASYYEGHVYDLIEQYVPRIKLINKNKPNRSKEDWMVANADRVKSLNQVWRAANKDHIKCYYKGWSAANREYERNRSKKWRDKNPEYRNKWRQLHPEYFKEYHKRNKHKDK